MRQLCEQTATAVTQPQISESRLVAADRLTDPADAAMRAFLEEVLG